MIFSATEVTEHTEKGLKYFITTRVDFTLYLCDLCVLCGKKVFV